MSFRLLPTRTRTVAAEAMVASSQAVATQAGVQLRRAGGNAVDAALGTAAMLCVAEPHATGIGGDLFALVRTAEGQLFALDAAGPAPRHAPAEPPAAVRARMVSRWGSELAQGLLGYRPASGGN